MKLTLNLTDNLKSDIKFEISKFPDGQQTLDITDSRYGLQEILNSSVEIRSRLNNFKDLELIICANQALKNLNVKNVELYVPYFLGSRSDRKFQDGGVNYLKQVICPIINSQNFSRVTVLDPHSDVLEACLNNYYKQNNHDLVHDALDNIIGDNEGLTVDLSNYCLVSPDAGAYKKVFDVAQKIGIQKIITATKVRDTKTGDIIRTEIPVLDQHNDIKYIIVDDICDGGRTFVELANAIKWGRPSARVYLIVTHGIFSVGFGKLNEYFEQIFTTNSVEDFNFKNTFEGTQVISGKRFSQTVKSNLLTQINVF